VDNDTKYRTLDLFSGIGGISLGLQRWCKTVCYCEIDPYACGVLIKNMAEGNIDTAPIWSDVTTLGQTELDAIGRIDCITGGFPCQDISCAGKGAGIVKGETRSGLFFEIVRLVRMVRPQIIFLENVPAITVRGLDTVLAELAACGYDARWKVLSAAEMGAPHKRDRWWCLVHTKSQRHNKITKIHSKTTAKPEYGQRILKQHTNTIRSEIWEVSECDFLPESDDVSSELDGIRCYGNTVVPQCVEKAFEILYEDIL